MFSLLSQYALLNPNAGKGFLKSIASTINKKMYPNLSENEINSVIDSVLKKREVGSLELYLNDERRILFNPKVLLTQNEKMKIVNTELGKRKSDHTKEIIYLVLENWDFEADGKITQEKVAQLAKRDKSTIKRHWDDFKSYVKDLNSSYKTSVTLQEPDNAVEKKSEHNKGITVEQYLYNMKCKFSDFDTGDERFLANLFSKQGITHVSDEGFKPIHDYMAGILKNRHYNYR